MFSQSQMFIIEYKYNSISPSVNGIETVPDGHISDDVLDMQIELDNVKVLEPIVYPRTEIAKICGEEVGKRSDTTDSGSVNDTSDDTVDDTSTNVDEPVSEPSTNTDNTSNDTPSEISNENFLKIASKLNATSLHFSKELSSHLLDIELRYVFTALSQHRLDFLNSRSPLPLHSASFSLTELHSYSPSTKLLPDDVFVLTNINSSKEIHNLSHVASFYSSVYLYKSNVLSPFDDRVYVFLIKLTETNPTLKPSRMIYKLPDIIDYGLTIYSRMIYLRDLALTMSSSNELNHNYVSIPNIKLKSSDEYKLYIFNLFRYFKWISAINTSI